MSASSATRGAIRSGAASAGYVPSPSVKTMTSKSSNAVNAARTACPLPCSGTSMTRTPSPRAIAPVPSVELLSKTTISALGKAARNCAITMAIAAASLKQGMATAILLSFVIRHSSVVSGEPDRLVRNDCGDQRGPRAGACVAGHADQERAGTLRQIEQGRARLILGLAAGGQRHRLAVEPGGDVG